MAPAFENRQRSGSTEMAAKQPSDRGSLKEIYGTGESAGAVQPKPKSEDLGEWWLSVVRPTEAVDHLAGPLANDRRLRPSRRGNSAILPVQPNPSWADNHEELGFPTEDRRVGWIRRIAHRPAVHRWIPSTITRSRLGPSASCRCGDFFSKVRSLCASGLERVTSLWRSSKSPARS